MNRRNFMARLAAMGTASVIVPLLPPLAEPGVLPVRVVLRWVEGRLNAEYTNPNDFVVDVEAMVVPSRVPGPPDVWTHGRRQLGSLAPVPILGLGEEMPESFVIDWMLTKFSLVGP